MKRRYGIVLLLMTGLLFTGCGHDKTSNGANAEMAGQTAENNNETEAPTKQPEEEREQGTASKAQEKLKRTSHYLFFDEGEKRAEIRMDLKDISAMKDYDKVVCYRDDEIITEETTILTSEEDYILEFSVEEFVDGFNRIEVTSGNDSEFIEVGEYHFNKLGQNTIKGKAQMELVSYQLDEGIDDVDADFFLEGDFKKYRVECQIPEKLKETGLLEYDYSLELDGLEFDSELSERKFRESELYCLEFDMAVIQKEAGTDKQYRIVSHRFQLMEQ